MAGGLYVGDGGCTVTKGGLDIDGGGLHVVGSSKVYHSGDPDGKYPTESFAMNVQSHQTDRTLAAATADGHDYTTLLVEAFGNATGYKNDNHSLFDVRMGAHQGATRGGTTTRIFTVLSTSSTLNSVQRLAGSLSPQ